MKAKPLGLLVISLSLFSVADGQTIDDLKSRLLRTHVSEDPSLSGPRAYKVDAEAAYDIEAVTIDLQLDGRRLPERATFEVTLTIRDSTVERVAFTAPFFQVESVSMTDGDLLDANHLEGIDQVIVDLGSTSAAGDQLTILMDVTLNIPCDMPTNCLVGEKITHVALPGWYPLNGIEPTSDRFFITLKAPAGPNQIISASGSTAQLNRAEMDAVYHFQTGGESLFQAIAIAPFEQTNYAPGVELFAIDSTAEDLDFVGEITTTAQQVYAGLFGPYPYERLAVTAIDEASSTALGPEANVFIPLPLWLNDTRDDMKALAGEVISHEIAHQYFFNLIKVTGVKEAWMSEGFAEFASTVYSEQQTGRLDHSRRNYWQYISRVPPPEDRPLWSTEVRTSPFYFPIVYQKGSAVLRLLQTRLGPEEFARVMQAYVLNFMHRETNTAAFRTFLASEINQPWVDDFFAAWIERRGFPNIYVRARRGRTDESPVTLTIWHEPSVDDPFMGQIPITIWSEEGPQDIEVALAGETLAFDASAAQWFDIDPNYTLIREITPVPPQDLNLSGVVDGMDLLDLNALIGTDEADEAWQKRYDLNGDRRIDQTDVTRLIESFGEGWSRER